MQLKLIENWRHGWKFWSVRIQLLCAVLSGLMVVDPATLLSAWNAMPPAVRDVLPHGFIQKTGLILFALNLLAIVARGVAQRKLGGKADG